MGEATAPASAANLGPGFDILALALELRCRVTAEPAPGWVIQHLGPELTITGQPDRVLEAARLASEQPLSVRVWNEIPVARGLGSSAAAAVAGFAAAKRAIGEPVADREAYRVAADLDGHPDNAAAASFGGLVAVTQDGGYQSLGLEDSLRLVVAVPDLALSTVEARGLLPDMVARPVVVRSLARLVTLIEGLRTGDAELLRNAQGDELHEEPRSELRPDVHLLIEVALGAGARYACWSGAGPSILALAASDELEDVRHALAEADGFTGRVLALEIARTGLT